MAYNFSIQIDDDDHTLSSTNGISLKYLWELLRDLYKSIEVDEESKCTLSNVRGNCYALDFSTEDKRYHDKFVIVHKNIEELPISYLAPEERNYAKTLTRVLGNKFHLNAYDNDKLVIATLRDLSKAKEIKTYYAVKTVYGVLAELGGKSISSSRKHICIDGFPYNISISKDLDLELKKYYGTHKLRVTIRARLSADKHRIISAEMLNFQALSENKLSGNLTQEGYIDLEIYKQHKSVNDIIDLLYGKQK